MSISLVFNFKLQEIFLSRNGGDIFFVICRSYQETNWALKTKKINKLIAAILSFTFLVFAIGTFVFFRIHGKNVSLKNSLETSGITTKGYVISFDKEESRSLGQTNVEWQYMTNYIVSYWYEHSGEKGTNEFALENFIDTDKKKQPANVNSLGKVEIVNSISKSMYKDMETRRNFDIVYLPGEPNSAMILDDEGEFHVPPMNLFAYLCLALGLGSLFILINYLPHRRIYSSLYSQYHKTHH